MPEPIHLLSGHELRQVTVVCGSRTAQFGTWKLGEVTCQPCKDLGTCALKPKNPTTGQLGRPAGLSEKQWLQQVVDLARSMDYLVYHPYNSRKSAPGWPDLALAKAGCPLYLCELKVAGGQLSGQQRHWLETLRQTTGLGVDVWRPGDWGRILELLRL